MPLRARAFSATFALFGCLFPIVNPALAWSAVGSGDASALRGAVGANPGQAASLVAQALQPASQITPRRAAEITTAAISGLGPAPALQQVSAVVYSAVRAIPDYVLEIVRAAVTAAPADTADEIAAAAVSALPDPWKRVLYRRVGAPIYRGERDFKGGPDFKGEPDYKEPAPSEGTPMSLAEAVVQTVLDSRAGMSAPAVYAAVEAVLRSAPGWLITAIYDPRGISGVGDAGTNNYANEPFRRRPPTLAPKPASTPTPIKPRVPATPPPVSQ